LLTESNKNETHIGNLKKTHQIDLIIY